MPFTVNKEKKKAKKVIMYPLAWRNGAEFATSNGKLSLFFRAGYWSAIGHGRLLHLG